MLGIGDKLPSFEVVGVKPGFNVQEEKGQSAFETLTEASFPGKWKVIFFYPKDFTFVCPTEIADRITTALVVPTIREAINIWDRFRIPKDASMATSPPKVRKRKITRFRPAKMLIKMAPNTVVKVKEILSWCSNTSSNGRMAKGRT